MPGLAGQKLAAVGEAQTTVRRKEEERLPLSRESDSPRRQFVMGDVFPDFDSMTPEEQMAWLESLAKRQGVKDEELTTKADLDIPIPEDAKVDEPGYVPFEGSASARRMKEAQEAAEAEAKSVVEESPEELAWIEAESEAPVEEIDIFAEATDAADPMLWLDSLAAQPEGDLGDLESLFAESEAVDFEEIDLFDEQPAPPDFFEPEEPAAQEASVAAGDDDPLGGMDPMLWLESLAKRQGANMDELVTSADLQVQEVPEGTVVDEPGYIPFEGSASARKMKEAADAALPPESIPEAVGEEVTDYSPPEEVEVEEFFDEQLESGEDSMRWLESLAKRQGASSEEFLTQADLDIPELPEDTVIDEPGYVEYSPFSILPADQDLDMPEFAASEAQSAGFGAEDEALSWLEDLAAEPDEDLSGILAFGEEMFEPVAEEVESEVPAVEARAASGDPLEGMTDEEIAYAQAHGQLTGMQELAWLKRQAAKLAQVRDSQDAEMMVEEEEISEEIVPADLPPWLVQMRVEAEETSADILGSAAAELPAESVDFSEWLEEVPAVEEEVDLAEMAFDTAELTEADVDSLWGETTDEAFEIEELALPDDSELAKFLAEGIVPEGADPLAEALDAEYERKLSGDESEPDWYTDAVIKATAESIETEAEGEASAEEEEAATLIEASLVDMPDWLRDTDEEIEAVIADEAAMPDWLRESGESEAAAQVAAPEWFEEEEEKVEPAVVEEELPDWLRELDKAPEEESVESVEVVEPAAEVKPAPQPEPAPPPPVPAPAKPAAAAEPEIRKPAPVKPVVQGELLEKITQRLQTDPNDHATRLAFARALRDSQQTTPSLDQYETLIETAQLLQDVADDLSGLAEAQPDTARVRRLLGDAYMRRGMLQEALNAYRSALEQL